MSYWKDELDQLLDDPVAELSAKCSDLRHHNRQLRAQLEAALAELERLKSSLAPKKRKR